MSRKTSLVETVTEKLIEMICDEYKPGDRIPSEFELAKRFDVSRATVRESIKQLCTRNVLEIRHGDGTFVSETPGMMKDPLGLSFLETSTALKDLSELSCIIQPRFAALAAARATDNDIQMLDETTSEFLTAFNNMNVNESKQIDAVRLLDSNFHDLLMVCCHNEAISRLSSLFTLMLEETPVNRLAVIKISALYHPKILNAIKTHDPLQAEQSMVIHMSLNADLVHETN